MRAAGVLAVSPEAVLAQEGAVPERVADELVVGDGKRISMSISVRRLCATLLLTFWLGHAHAAPVHAPELQRSFASPEEAATAFVAALRDHKEAELRAILGPEADRVINSGDRYADRELQ